MNRLMTGYGTKLGAAAMLAGTLVAGAACGKAVREGRASSYLVVESLMASSGGQASTLSNTLASDVVTNATVYADIGQVNLRIAMKDPGTPDVPTAPTTTNEITINRYHVAYVLEDGRNTPGVNVPDPFDGAVTGTVTSNGVTLTFVLVRVEAKLQAPLIALRGGGFISTIADVTFYGRDQAGNDVSVVARISVNFADWGDPLAPATLPTADFVFSPTAPIVGQQISFNASGSKAATGRRIVSYAWDFGYDSRQQSGITATAQTNYPLAGTYTVTLVVTDDIGQTASKSQPVTVR